MLQNTSLQRLKGGNSTTGLLSGRLITRPRELNTRGSQKVLGNPLLTENERYDSACSDVVVSLACLLAVTTGLVRFRRAVLLLYRFS